MIFNVNQCVKVKLNEKGRNELKRQGDKIKEKYPNISLTFPLPEEDEEGWSKWQLHSLINQFGHMMVTGNDLPFDTEIEIIK